MRRCLQRLTLPLLLALAAPLTGAQQSGWDTRRHVETLASERFGGRQAGSDGERRAAEYLAAELVRLGARPLPGRADMFMPFEFTAGSRDGGSTIQIGERTFGDRSDVQALSFSDDAEVAGPPVFAGYGIVVPESQGFGYDSYAGIDVTDKIVVVLRYFPEDADQRTRAILARYSDLRYKALAARQRGARAILVVTGPRSPNAGRVVPMTFDTAIAGSGIPAASLGGDAVAALWAGPRSLEDVQRELDSGNPHVVGFDLPGRTVRLRTTVVRERQIAHNVLAYLPATGPMHNDKPWVAIGAHFDHLGAGAGGTSLARPDEAGRPHPGADDNASGTAAVLAIAEALAREAVRPRHLLIAFWSAEEIGLIGSAAFAAEAPVPTGSIAAYLNFDMVGRMQDNRLAVQATGTSPVWSTWIERANIAAGFDLSLQPDPYQPTDVSTFNQAEVPSLSFTTGAHADYHRPSDTPEKIAYDDLDRIAAFAAAIVRRVMGEPAPPAFTRVDPPAQGASRAGLRVFTGTIPDYTASVQGLLLGGVIAGGPADQAGLQKGDVIVEIAGQTIANIYDYTYALDLLKVGEPVTVVYVRGAERRQTTLTPGARQ